MMKFTTSPEDARKKWVAALLSGDYEAGARGIIRDGDKFDPLGVACDVFMQTEGKGHWVPIGWYFNSGEDIKSNFLPTTVARWLGNDDVHFRLADGSTVARRNDDGATFQEIAAMVSELG